jgi:hypothetical protein
MVLCLDSFEMSCYRTSLVLQRRYSQQCATADIDDLASNPSALI